MDRRSLAELRLVDAIGHDSLSPGPGKGDSIVEQVERAPRGKYGPGFPQLIRLIALYPRLAPDLGELVALRASQRAKQAEIVGAAAGPVVTLVGVIAACTVASAWVFPAFDSWMYELDINSPAGFYASRRTMAVVFGPLGLSAVCAVLLGLGIAWYKGALGRLTFRARAVAAPIRASAMRSLAIAIEKDLPTEDALSLGAAVISHPYASERLLGIRRASAEGTPLWDLLSRSHIVPRSLLTSIRAADGKTMSAALDGLARYFSVEAKAGSMKVRVLVGAAVTLFSSILCVWLAVTIALGYAAVIG